MHRLIKEERGYSMSTKLFLFYKKMKNSKEL